MVIVSRLITHWTRKMGGKKFVCASSLASKDYRVLYKRGGNETAQMCNTTSECDCNGW